MNSSPTFLWSPAPGRAKPRHVVAMVREALVPMLLWPSVPVLRRVEEGLTILERLIIEGALAMCPIRAEDVEEVTGVPQDVVVRIAGRLCGLGVLRTAADGYYAEEEPARAALERNSVTEHRPGRLTFLYLPGTDELLAFEGGPRRPEAPPLHLIEPAVNWPVPEVLGNSSRAVLLQQRIRAREVVGLPDSIVDAEVSDDVLPDRCPAYRCRGHVRSKAGDVTLELDVVDEFGRMVRKCVIPGAAGLAGAWQRLAEQVEQVFEQWRAEGGAVDATRSGPVEWMVRLDGRAADRAVRDGVTLSRPARVTISTQDTAVELEVLCEPVDAAAARLFAMHHAVQSVVRVPAHKLTPGALDAAAKNACVAYGLDDHVLAASDIQQRLWSDGRYQHVYALRSVTDFAYA